MPVLFPFEANTDCEEVMQFLTDVLPAYSAEQRIAVRSAPRQILRYDFDMDEADYAAADALVRSQPLGQWYVPLWFEAIRVGSISSGANSITVDATDRDYRVGQRLMIWDTAQTAETVGIGAISDSAITLSSGLSQSYTMAWAAPIVTAVAPAGLSRSRSLETFITTQMQFISVDQANIGNSDFDQYLSSDVVSDRSVMVSDISGQVVQASVTIDSSTGPLVLEPTQSYVRSRNAIQFADEGPDRYRRRRWLHSILGRQKDFWVPTWNADFALLSDIGSADTSIQVSGLTDAAINRHILIETKSGHRFYRQIIGAAGQDATISSALGSTVSIADVSVICFLDLLRMEADEISLIHQGTNYTEFQALVTTA